MYNKFPQLKYILTFMPKLIDITNQVFGKLTVLSRVSATGQALWLCRCSCGKTTEVPGYELRKGLIKSCGCLKAEFMSKLNLKHGHSKVNARSREYSCWLNMKNRCYLPSKPDYSRYGALGITVCDSWLSSFENFLADMGKCPPNYTIDRIDSSGNYEPSNCRWADIKTQANNRKNVKQITMNGKTQSVTQWCEELNLKPRTIRARIYERGWDAIKALTT